MGRMLPDQRDEFCNRKFHYSAEYDFRRTTGNLYGRKRHDKTTIIVVQKQQDALTVTTNKIELPTAGCDFNIEVKANIPFDYEIGNDCKEWISRVDKTRTLQSSVLTFHAQPSEDADTRSGTVTIKSGQQSERVTVFKQGVISLC